MSLDDLFLSPNNVVGRISPVPGPAEQVPIAALMPTLLAQLALPTGAANVGFLPSGTGAVATDLQTRGRLVKYSTDFGTKMVTSPGADINLAINAVNLAGGGTVVVPAGSYTIETTILQKSNVWIDFSNSVFTAATGLNAPMLQNASSITSLTVSGITTSGRTATATTSTAHGYVVGDWVHVSGAAPDGYNGWHKVIATPLTTTFTYYVDKNIGAVSGTIACFKFVETNLRLANGKFVGNAANVTGSNYGVYFEGVKELGIDNFVVDGTVHNGVFLSSVINGKLYRVRGDNVINAAHNGILLGQSTSLRYSDEIELVACGASANGQDGIILERGHGVRLVACGGEYNGLGAIKIGKASDVRVNGCWGKYNTANGIQIQPSGAIRNITIALGDFCENGESGIYVGNPDTANPLVDVSLIGNQCHRNGQINASTSYGIAFECSASATIDRITVIGNHCDEQGRGISFNTNGTYSNVVIVSNSAQGNTANYFLSTALQVSTTQSDIWLPFTPALKFGGASVGLTYGTQIGRFQKIGTTCRFQITLILTAKGSSVGEPSITGLPCTAKNLATYYATGAPYTDVVTFGDGIQFFISPNGTAMNFRKIVSGGTNTIPTEADFANTSTLLITGSYETE